jgi:hypothetical protein
MLLLNRRGTVNVDVINHVVQRAAPQNELVITTIEL